MLSVADMMSSISNSYRLNNYISFGSDVVSQINDRRSRFNKTHLVSTNNLWNLGKNFDLTSQINYLHDRTESDSRSEVQYFLNDKTIATVAGEHDNERQNQLAADKCEHYYNEINADVKKTLVLADADFTYCFKGGWEVNLAVTNIFDQQHYAYRSYNGTMSLYQSYKIRPRKVLASVYFRF